MSIPLVRSVLNSVVVQWRRLDASFADLDQELAEPSAPGAPKIIDQIAKKQREQIKKLRDLCSKDHSKKDVFDSTGQAEILTYAISKLSAAALRPNQRIFQALNLLRGGTDFSFKAKAGSEPPFEFNSVDDIRAKFSSATVPFSVDDALVDYAETKFEFGAGGATATLPLIGPAADRNVAGSVMLAQKLLSKWFIEPAAVAGGGGFTPTGTFGAVDDLDATPRAREQIALLSAQIGNLAEFIAAQMDLLAEMISDESLYPNIRGIRQGVEDIGAYPLLTSEMPPTGGYRYGGGSGGGGGIIDAAGGAGTLSRVVDGALRGVLGRSPRVADTRSFANALRQSFNVAVVEGRTEVRYEARSFAGQADLGGGVTGAQASLYSRAAIALDKALPLLEGLEPLDPAADEELVGASRAIVRQEMIELVNALRAEGGPTSARVDRFIESLFGEDAAERDAEVRGDNPGGHFSDLVAALGMTDDRINTLEEESNYSNYLAVFDFANQIRTGWIEFRDTFQGKDLGTRLVQLSRALSVAAETVDEVYAAMDSVFVGPAERQVSSFTPVGGRTVLVSELLQWVVDFTTDEAPKLVLEGGRRGIRAVQPTAETLEGLVRGLLEAIDTDPGIPQGMRHARVRFPLQELRTYLGEIQHLADVARRTPRQLAP